MKLKTYLRMSVVLFSLLILPKLMASCPDPDPRTRTMFTRADVAVIGAVVSARGVDEKGNPTKKPEDLQPLGEAATLIYKVKTEKFFKGSQSDTVEICEGNTSARMGIELGHKYLFMVKRNEKGELCGGCYDAIDSLDNEYEKVVAEIAIVMANIKKGADGDILGFIGTGQRSGSDGLAGFHLVLKGRGRPKIIISDKKGWFHIPVRPGHYKIESLEPNKPIEMTDYSPDDPAGFDVLTAGGAELGLKTK
jgi:hypothetical protein